MSGIHIIGLFFLGLAVLSGMARVSVAKGQARRWLAAQEQERRDRGAKP